MKWKMIRHIAVATRANRVRYCEMVRDIGLPSLHLATTEALAALDYVNGLRRQGKPRYRIEWSPPLKAGFCKRSGDPSGVNGLGGRLIEGVDKPTF